MIRQRIRHGTRVKTTRRSAMVDPAGAEVVFHGGVTDAEYAALLADLLSAVRRRCAVELTYRSGQASISERRVDPYRALHLEGRWYLVGWCHLRGELRSFRLDRIRAHMLTQETFTPPADFDALAFVRRGLPTPTMFEIDVWIAAPPEALRGQLSLWHTDIRPDGTGTRVRCQRESLGFFAAFLLGLPYEFRVHGPPELPGEFRRLAERGDHLRARHLRGAARGAKTAAVQLTCAGHGDVGGDPGAEQQREHQQLEQRCGLVAQRDSRVLRVRGARPLE